MNADRASEGVERTDEGAILILALIVTVLLSLVVVGMATYTTTVLQYGQVSETRSDRLSAADGAMRDALERLRLSRSLCATALGDGSGFGMTFPELINGASAVVTCQRMGVKIEAVQAWAVVVTGEGVASGGSSFEAVHGGGEVKKIGGPVFVDDLDGIAFSVPVQMVEGDLFYTDAACPSDGASTDLGDSISDLSFEPADTRGTICTKRTWQEIFGSGPVIPDLSETVGFPTRTPTSYTTVGSCRVFSPGIYEAPGPSLSSGSNYFKSGNYVLRNVTLTTSGNGQILTAGRADPDTDIAQAIPNTDCDAARDSDTGLPGATLYLDGSSRIDVNKGAIEILGRKQGASWVTVQTLPTSTLTAASPVISTGNGNNKEFASQGLVWAPYAAIDLGNITNSAVVQLRGGTVVARFHIGASASINSFVIEVPTSALTQALLLTSTATKSGSTSIRAVVEYRAPSEVAVKSWRIVH